MESSMYPAVPFTKGGSDQDIFSLDEFERIFRDL